MTPPAPAAAPSPAIGSTSRRAIADALVIACRDAGTTHMFGVPGGGSNLDVVGAAAEHGVQFVLAHTETAAAVMAGVMGELTGAPGVCVATRGPGVASAVNGVAQALLDRQPMVLVTDCVAHADQARISHQRIPQQDLLGSVSKASLVLDCGDRTSADVVDLALAAPPGPVHVDIDPTSPARSTTRPMPAPAIVGREADDLDEVLVLVRAARRPVLVVGLGSVARPLPARRAVVDAVNALGRATNVPVLCTYKARGVVPDRASWCAGVATGATIESPLLDDADLIVGVGLDPVELIPAPWAYAAPLVLLGSWAIDDSTYFGDRLAGEVVADLAESVAQIGTALVSTWPDGVGQQYRQQANREVAAAIPASPDGLTPQQVVTIAAAAAPAGTIATVDAGAHMLVAMQLWEVDAPGRLLVSSGLATMGFALPAAIAASLAEPDRSVVCFTGDGGLGMVLAELETLARLQLPVVVVVFNDSTLSLIAAKQQPEGHGGAAAVSYRVTDFAAVARACGMRSENISDTGEYASAMHAALESRAPTLLDVAVDPSAYGGVLDAIRGPRPAR